MIVVIVGITAVEVVGHGGAVRMRGVTSDSSLVVDCRSRSSVFFIVCFTTILHTPLSYANDLVGDSPPMLLFDLVGCYRTTCCCSCMDRSCRRMMIQIVPRRRQSLCNRLSLICYEIIITRLL